MMWKACIYRCTLAVVTLRSSIPLSFMTYHWVFNKSKVLHLPEHQSPLLVLLGFVLLNCIHFRFAIVFSVLRYTDSNYPFGIVKHLIHI